MANKFDKETKLYVTGFEQAGVDLFSMSAKKFYFYKQKKKLDFGDIVDQLKHKGLNIFITAYISKKNKEEEPKLSWTFKKTKDTFPIVDQQPTN